MASKKTTKKKARTRTGAGPFQDMGTRNARRNQERVAKGERALVSWAGDEEGDVRGQSVKSKKIREKRRGAAKARETRRKTSRGKMAAKKNRGK